MTFKNPIVGGISLVRQAIRSPNFDAGPPPIGWSINKDGTASFSTVTVPSRVTVNEGDDTAALGAGSPDGSPLSVPALQFYNSGNNPPSDPEYFSAVYGFTGDYGAGDEWHVGFGINDDGDPFVLDYLARLIKAAVTGDVEFQLLGPVDNFRINGQSQFYPVDISGDCTVNNVTNVNLKVYVMRCGRICDLWFDVTITSSSTFSGSVTIDLPSYLEPRQADMPHAQTGSLVARNVGVASPSGTANVIDPGGFGRIVPNFSGQPVNGSNPFTWGNGDHFEGHIRYILKQAANEL